MTRSASASTEASAMAGKPTVGSTSKAAGKGKKGKGSRTIWCLCKSADGSGPMIECGNCNDWYVVFLISLCHIVSLPISHSPPKYSLLERLLTLLSGSISPVSTWTNPPPREFVCPPLSFFLNHRT
jgi:hypothetical protein